MDKSLEKNIKILNNFFGVYCRNNHGTDGKTICLECDETLKYAIEKIKNCKLNPKPTCRKCVVHCFKKEYREKIKKVMKYSGIYYIKRGRIDWLIRYFWL